jgi:hypothetical protein
VADLRIEVVDAEVERYAFAPAIGLRLRVTESSGMSVAAVVLHAQVRVEPHRRTYTPEERERLVEVFGPSWQWGDSLKPFIWTQLSTAIGGFDGTVDVEVPLPCSYDVEVAGTPYLVALEDGGIPLVLLFSGTVFGGGPGGMVVEPVPWHLEARFELPVATWRGAMDRFFPGTRWIRLSTDTADALGAFKARQALPTWDQAVELLVKRAGETP